MIQEQEICSEDELQNNCLCNPIWHNNVMWVRECESYILPASLLWDPEFGSVLKPCVGTWLQYVMTYICWVQCKTAELGLEVTW